ncbi:unnamed protein product [Sympodiomycopsis kandeliae]
MSFTEPARVYALSGTGSGQGQEASQNSTSLPDLLRRHGRSNKRQKRRPQSKSSASINAQLDKIELIQDYEFPEASNKIKSTRDGNNLVATGTYKPHIRVWELDQLSLKFERHTNSENIDFVLLSDDWTKQLHLQTDRTLELHGQGGHHHRVRIPKFGRALAYHYQSAEAIVGAAGSEVYRLNLDQGRFMAPYQLGQGSSHGQVTGCNALDVNPAHGLLSLGTEGAGIVELWDQRSRRRAGALSIATPTIMDASLAAARRGLPGLVLPGEDANAVAVQNAMSALSVTALSSAQDGLNMAVGTSTGHVLLYDLRMDKPYATKDQGFSLPIKSLSWPGDPPLGTAFSSSSSSRSRGGLSSEAHDSVLSSDAKGIKIWNKNDPSSNLVSISPQSGTDLNDVHHLPGSGLVFAAVEGTQCAAWYVPTLGPAPRWCSFLDRLTDEIDQEQSNGGKRGVYEDFKFVDTAELESLEMDHLIGTNALRPYMHGYFVPLQVYERARLIKNPTSYTDARDRAIKAKLEKKAESRIRSVNNAQKNAAVKVQVNQDLATKSKRQQQRARDEEEQDEGEEGEASGSSKAKGSDLLSDSRFAELFTNPEFQVDTTSREYALLNPSSVAKQGKQKDTRPAATGSDDESQSESEADSDGDLGQFDPRNHAPGTRRRDLEKRSKRTTNGGARMVDGDDEDFGSSSKQGGQSTFQGRLRDQNSKSRRQSTKSSSDDITEGNHSITWTPGASTTTSTSDQPSSNGKKATKKGETFGAGLSKGSEDMDISTWEDDIRSGRKGRRKVERSASKNTMRSQR